MNRKTMHAGPQRIVCLTPETVDILYRLGEQDRVAGISGFTVHPPAARREKPKVSAYTTAKLDRILALKPDLVLGFSDLQADMAAQLIRAGVQVHVFNQRDVAGILACIDTLGRLIGATDRAGALVRGLQATIERIRAVAAELPTSPRVYFEEWDDPPITGIGWVSELIGVAGGTDIFRERAAAQDARRRIIEDPGEVVARAPDIIVGSWCGKKFRPERLSKRPGWAEIPAVRDGRVHEIKSADILQPGPVAIETGLVKLHEIIRAAA